MANMCSLSSRAAISLSEVTPLTNQTIIDPPSTHYAHSAEPEDAVDLEQAADELLAQHIPLGSDSGIYSQSQLDRKMRNEEKRLPRLAEVGISADTVDALLERRIEEMVDAASLTALQEIIYRLYAAGFGCRRIASIMGIRHRLLDRRLRTVKRKIRAAYEEGRYAGWYEVYLSEVNRPAYRRRK